VLILTDHDVKNHDNINKGVFDIVPGARIPQNFYLGYASSDRLHDVSNEILQYCDKEATRMLKDITGMKINNSVPNKTKSRFCEAVIVCKNEVDFKFPGMLYF